MSKEKEKGERQVLEDWHNGYADSPSKESIIALCFALPLTFFPIFYSLSLFETFVCRYFGAIGVAMLLYGFYLARNSMVEGSFDFFKFMQQHLTAYPNFPWMSVRIGSRVIWALSICNIVVFPFGYELDTYAGRILMRISTFLSLLTIALVVKLWM